MNNERIDWIDTLKLLGIFYIYLGHLGKDAGKLYPFVFSFHVPLFFFIAGLFFKLPNCKMESFRNIKKYFIRIMIPYLIFSIIGILVYAIKWDYPTYRIYDMSINALLGIRNHVPLASLWFLPCLFIVICYYCIVSMLTKSRMAIFLISIGFYCTTPYWFNLVSTPIFSSNFALNYLAFFSFGVLISRKVRVDWPSFYEGRGRPVMVCLLIICFAYFLYSYQYGTFILIDNIKQTQVRYLLVFILTCIMFIPSMAIAYWVNIDQLKKMGRNTLVLCGTEQILKIFVLSFLTMLGVKPTFTDPLQAVIFTLLCLLVSYFTIIKWYESFSFFRKKEY